MNVVPALANPVIIQGAECPAFVGADNGQQPLACAHCGNLLMTGHDTSHLIGIDIECFKCKGLTPGGEILPGEVLRYRLVKMRQGQRIAIKGPVNLSNTAIVSDDALAASLISTGPADSGFKFDLSEMGLGRLEAEYNRLTGQSLDKQKAIVSRKGDSAIYTFPFAWSVGKVADVVASERIDTDDPETMMPLYWLLLFTHCINYWRHHPRFDVIASDFGSPGKFLHTLSLFIAAKVLHDDGYRVALALEENSGSPNPDLYVPGGMEDGGRLHFEIKAPEKLQYRAGMQLTDDEIEDAVQRALIKASPQISRERRGVLLVCSTLPLAGTGALQRAARRALDAKGRDRLGLAAIWCLCLNPTPSDPSTRRVLGASMELTTVNNDHFVGGLAGLPDPTGQYVA